MIPSGAVIRLVLVDDHRIVRQGLRAVLEQEPDLEVVGEAGDVAGARSVVEALRPDVVLLDLRLGSADMAAGLDVCRDLCSRFPDTAVVVLTTFLDRHLLREALRGGARGYVLKDIEVAELVRIVRTVRQGGSGFDARTASVLAEEMRLERVTAAGPLTEREAEMMPLVARGLTNREIAAQLHVSESTVKFHLSNALHKLGADNRAELVFQVTRLGLIDSTGDTDR